MKSEEIEENKERKIWMNIPLLFVGEVLKFRKSTIEEIPIIQY